MKKVFLCNLVLGIILLTGCVEVPDEVYEEWYLYRSLTPEEQHRNAEDVEIKMSTPAECREQVEQYAGQTYAQLSFPEKIDIPDVEQVYTYKPVSFPYYDFFDEMADAFFTPGLDALDGQQYVQQEGWGDGYGEVWSSTEDMSMIWINNGGTFQIVNPHSYAYEDYQCKRVAAYSLGAGEQEEQSYLTQDGEMTISEALALADSYVEKLENIEQNFWTYSPYKLYVCEVSEDTYAFSLIYTYQYDGVKFDPVPSYPILDAEDYDYLWGGDALLLTISNHKTLDFIGKYGVTEKRTEEESYKTIVSLDSAVEIISRNLGKASVFCFDEVSLAYIYQIDNPVNQMTGERKYETFMLDDSTRVIRPFWVFAVDMNPADASILTHNLRNTVIIVDAVNGQMQYFHGNNYSY